MEKTVFLKKNYEFKNVFSKGKWLHGKYMILYFKANDLDYNRLGIAVSRKTGKSVVRNRLKRLLRESYRLTESNIASGFDIILLWKSKEVLVGLGNVLKDFNQLLQRTLMYEKGE